MQRRTLVQAAVVITTLVSGRAAHAIGGEGAARDTVAGDKPDTAISASDEQVIVEEDENGIVRRQQERLRLGIDFLLGFGNYTAVDTQYQQSGQVLPTYVFAESQVRTATFMIMGHYRFPKFGIGVRLPFVAGRIADPGGSITGTDVFNTGALEIALDMPRRLNANVRYLPEIALSFPTAPGSTPPYTQQELAAKQPSQDLAYQYDRYAVGLAAAFARGGEDDALFFNWRIGIVPKIGFDMKFNHTRIQPYVKIPFLISLEQNSSAEEPIRLEVVGGVRFAQEIGPIQIGVRFVGMIPIAARTSLKTPMLSAWPEVRVQVTPSAQLWLGGMIPLAGDYSIFDAGKNGAFQGGFSATF